jgi:hypothetical protein
MKALRKLNRDQYQKASAEESIAILGLFFPLVCHDFFRAPWNWADHEASPFSSIFRSS